jgi:hypothetical protein
LSLLFCEDVHLTGRYRLYCESCIGRVTITSVGPSRGFCNFISAYTIRLAAGTEAHCIGSRIQDVVLFYFEPFCWDLRIVFYLTVNIRV